MGPGRRRVSRVSNEFGFAAAVGLRLRTTPLRLVVMGVIALMLWTIGQWSWAPWWFTAYAGLQALIAAVSLKPRPDVVWRRRVHYALSAASFALAGTPTWHMWTRCGELGIAAAVMFLCGMLVQLMIGGLGERRLFAASAAPLVAYLIVLPPLAWNGPRLVEGLTVTASSLCLLAYLLALWWGYQKALAQSDSDRREAERAARAKSDFLAAMSHEVRTPMNAVLGAAGLLKRTPLEPAQADYVEMIASAGEVLMNVLNDILDLSKIEAGKFQIAATRTDLLAVVRRCADLWGPQAEASGLAFQTRIDPATPCWVMIDSARVSQILFNLLSNAVKFTEAGGIGLAVRAEPAGPDKVTLVITVDDTGPGIDPDVLPRLFGAFEQADPSIARRFGGTGLGLAISQRLAQLMGGSIGARSELGQGSSFELTLPARVVPATSEPEIGLSSEPDGPRPDLRILVAEDNAVNRKIVEALLSPLGAAVTFAENGAEALDALQNQAFDVVLMDIQMPVMDGIEATRRLRASSGPNAAIPVIALTANVMEEQCRSYRAAGMDAEIAKPIDPQRLLAVIGELAGAERTPPGAEARLSGRP